MMNLKLYAFDLDHTLIQANSSFKFGTYLYQKKVFSFFHMLQLASFYFRHKVFQMPLQELHTRVFNKLFRGRSKKEIDAHVQDFLNALPGFLNPAVISELNSAEGLTTCLLSSSPDFIVEPIAKKLGISMTLSSLYQVQEGKFHSMGKVIQGEDKAEFLLNLYQSQGLDPSQCVFYTDSILDQAVFPHVGQVVAVNPDRALLHLSQRNNWRLIKF